MAHRQTHPHPGLWADTGEGETLTRRGRFFPVCPVGGGEDYSLCVLWEEGKILPCVSCGMKGELFLLLLLYFCYTLKYLWLLINNIIY